MKLNITLTTGKDDAGSTGSSSETPAPIAPGPVLPPDRISEAMDLLQSEWAKAVEPGLDAVESARRAAWMGGAIRLYALLTSSSPEEVKATLTSSTPPPAAPSRYAGMIPAVVQSTSERPKRHPGAQRPVDPELPPEQAEVPEGSTYVDPE